MKAELHNGSIMVIPETEFERQWMSSAYKHGATYKAFTRLELMGGEIRGMLIDSKSQIERAKCPIGEGS